MWLDILKGRHPSGGTPGLPGSTPRRSRFHPYSRYRTMTYTPPPTPAAYVSYTPTSSTCAPQTPLTPSAYAPQTLLTLCPSPTLPRPISELNFGGLGTMPPKPRFAPPLQGSLLDDMCRPAVPSLMKNNNAWATGVFRAWVSTRNSLPQISVANKFPCDILETQYPVNVHTLAAFILEACRADGNPYPSSTLKKILTTLFCVMKKRFRAVNVTNFVDKSAQEKYFPLLHNALDRTLRELRENGIGVERKRASLITPDIENKLWNVGIIGTHSPQALLNAVFFYNGKNFCLRGISEHMKLKFSQITHQPSKYTYSTSQKTVNEVKLYGNGTTHSLPLRTFSIPSGYLNSAAEVPKKYP